ncbi:MAG: alpha/beta fold hydrolase [Butyricicoccus sp.]|jgi:pimeloyl-ACP methyl ester carboxylesterase
MELRHMMIGGSQMTYTVLGEGSIDLVIEMGLGACIEEWRHAAKKIAETHTVLLYERLGCGTSGRAENRRTPRRIAEECALFLDQLPHEEKIVLLAHSQGGLYAQQFARMYPERVKALILLDPLSADDGRFRRELSGREYRKSGVDKRGAIRLSLLMSRLPLKNIMRNMVREAPPFYYYRGFEEDAAEYILDCAIRPQGYRTALAEYREAHREENLAELRNPDGFPPVPIRLITHASEIAVSEIMQFGGLKRKEAEKVERIWQELMGQYLALGSDSRWDRAEHSSHAIHLTDLDLVCNVAAEF